MMVTSYGGRSYCETELTEFTLGQKERIENINDSSF